MRILVVDNGGQWTHREWRVLKYLGVETKIVPNTTSYEELQDVDGLVLSGGAPRIGLGETLGRCGDYLDRAPYPILGICAGHHFMATHFGGKAEPGKLPEYGTATIEREGEDDTVFAGLPQRFKVWESHNDDIAVLPRDFVRLAFSDNCQVQAMKSTARPLFGLQFHPEVENTEHGEQIFRNFLDVCKR